MKFATIGHLMVKKDIEQIPKEWIHEKLIVSPELNIKGIKGYIIGLKFTAKQMIGLPQDKIRQDILDAALFIQDELDVNLIQLGALITSVTSGGKWLVDQGKYSGFVNHGDSYSSAVTCQTVLKSLKLVNKNPSDVTIAIIGAYGIIGEAVSKILVPQFNHSILIGRRENKLDELKEKIEGNFETTTSLITKNADVIVTATSHHTALLKSEHLKKNAIVIDVSQPPNLSYNVCQQRTDIFRVDGGFVDLPEQYPFQIPAIPKGKIFSCVAEVLMQAMENEKQNHVGSIDIKHLKKTEEWAEKYSFALNELTNYGNKIENKHPG
jgi:predicted amino acid dehydrogenase